MTRAVYPGSFDPLTVAHLGIAHAAVAQAGVERVDLALSRRALGKEHGGHLPLDARVAAIERAARTRPWLGAVVTDDQLITDIARGYDAVIMGADKWAQVRDAQWYGGDSRARDEAVAALPRVLVVPRPGFPDVDGAELLDVDGSLADVSSTRARAGEHHLLAPEARPRLIVDGNNLMGSRADGWWRDRAGATARIIHEMQTRARRTGERIAVVLDGAPLPDYPEGVHDGVLVAYARRRGRNAADDRIVEEVARDRDPASLTVVTSDRDLASRLRELGARVVGVSALRESASR
jgi:predicted RNA-binding protein with PIN domain